MSNQDLRTFSNGDYNGYCLFRHADAVEFSTYDLGQEIESIIVDSLGEIVSSRKLDIENEDLDLERFFEKNKELYNYIKILDAQQRWSGLMDIACYDLPTEFSCQEAMKMVWAYERSNRMKEGNYSGDVDVMPFYTLQNELRQKIVSSGDFNLDDLKYIGGCDVGYSDEENKMIGAVVVFDASTMKVVDKAWCQMEISFPYIPGLFSFRETPPILEAFKKLRIIPDLIVCDAHGVSHPRGIGMASHLGVILDTPTIGCAKKRLIGNYDKAKLGKERGAFEHLKWNSQIVGAALRTQTNVNPVFVSVGHKVDLEIAMETILKLSNDYRLPETTRAADQLVNKVLKNRTEVDFMGDE